MKHLFAMGAFCLLLAPSVFSQSGWVDCDPTTTQALTSVFCVDPNHVWAVGGTRVDDPSLFVGRIIQSADLGVTWQWQTSGVKKILRDVFFLNDSLGWVVGYGGTILKTTDGGENWMVVPNDSLQQLESVFFIDENLGWACGVEASIAKTTDGGLTWQYADNHLFRNESTGRYPKFRSIFFLNSKKGWMVGHDRWILHTEDGGKNWQQIYSLNTYEDLRYVQFVDAQVGYAIGEKGVIIKTTDGGNSWEHLESGTWEDLWTGYFVNEEIGWAAGASGTVLKTTDGGRHWLQQETGTGKLINDMVFLNQETGWLVGEKGLMLRTITGGDVVTEPPVFVSAGSIEISPDQLFSYTAEAQDPQGHTLAYSYTDYPNWMHPAGAVISGTPTASSVDTSFTVMVSNGAFEIKQTVTVTVLQPNSPPCLASPDTAIATEDVPFTYVVRVSDPDNDDVTFAVDQLPDWLTWSGDTIAGTPGEVDADTGFQVIVSDGALSSQVWVTVKVMPVNDSPEIIRMTDIELSEGELFVADLDTCVTDPDDANQTLQWQVTASVPEVVPVLDGHLLSVSATGWAGNADLSLMVRDAQGACDSISVQLVVSKSSGIASANGLPRFFELEQNYPNPFNPVTEIRYDIPYDALIDIVVYNERGEQVETLVSGMEKAGYHVAEWDAHHAAAGLYFIRMHGPDFLQTRKCVLVK